jgi:hypothetical protein
MDLREIGWRSMNWIDVAQGRGQWRALVYTVMNLRVPYYVGKLLSSCTIFGFSRRAQLHEVSYYLVLFAARLVLNASPLVLSSSPEMSHIHYRY